MISSCSPWPTSVLALTGLVFFCVNQSDTFSALL
jgi:hypothetical protein